MIAVEIASERARNFDNNRTIANAKIPGSINKQTIIELKDALGKTPFCVPCWLHNDDADHNFSTCESTALGWTHVSNEFRSMRSVELPTKHCFNCCLLQVYFHHHFISIIAQSLTSFLLFFFCRCGVSIITTDLGFPAQLPTFCAVWLMPCGCLPSTRKNS